MAFYKLRFRHAKARKFRRKQWGWTPWRKASLALLDDIPALPGVYQFGLVIADRAEGETEPFRQLDIVYIGVGGSRDDRGGGLKARLQEHLSGHSHIPYLRQAIKNGTAFLSWLVHPLAYSMEVDLIQLYTPAFNTTHNPHPRMLTETELLRAINTPIPEEVWNGPVYLPARIRALLTGQLPENYLISKSQAVLPKLAKPELERLLRYAEYRRSAANFA